MRTISDSTAAKTVWRTEAELGHATPAPGSPDRRAARRASLLRAARDILEGDLSLPGLSSATVAAELGISLRQVHLLFEPTGLSFARTVTAQRLERARRLLREMPGCAVVDIGRLCGFDSKPTFYRVFRRAYGRSPGASRTMADGG
jgi:transcriptional regulator GlxA family with amidase domain